jgi:hypothetical protein
MVIYCVLLNELAVCVDVDVSFAAAGTRSPPRFLVAAFVVPDGDVEAAC